MRRERAGKRLALRAMPSCGEQVSQPFGLAVRKLVVPRVSLLRTQLGEHLAITASGQVSGHLLAPLHLKLFKTDQQAFACIG